MGKLPNYVQYFGLNILGGVEESWVEAEISWVEVEMRWVEVDGAGWSWVEVDGTGWRWVFKNLVVKYNDIIRSSRPEVFLGKGVPKISRKFTGEHP